MSANAKILFAEKSNKSTAVLKGLTNEHVQILSQHAKKVLNKLNGAYDIKGLDAKEPSKLDLAKIEAVKELVAMGNLTPTRREFDKIRVKHEKPVLDEFRDALMKANLNRFNKNPKDNTSFYMTPGALSKTIRAIDDMKPTLRMKFLQERPDDYAEFCLRAHIIMSDPCPRSGKTKDLYAAVDSLLGMPPAKKKSLKGDNATQLPAVVKEKKKIVNYEDIKRRSPSVALVTASSTALTPYVENPSTSLIPYVQKPSALSRLAAMAVGFVVGAAAILFPSPVNESTPLAKEFNNASLSAAPQIIQPTTIEQVGTIASEEKSPIITTNIASLSQIFEAQESVPQLETIMPAPAVQTNVTNLSYVVPANLSMNADAQVMTADMPVTVSEPAKLMNFSAPNLDVPQIPNLDAPQIPNASVIPPLTINNLSQRIEAFYQDQNMPVHKSMTDTLQKMEWGISNQINGHAEMRAQEAGVIMLSSFGSDVAGEFARQINHMIVHNDDKIDTNAERVASRDLSEWPKVVAAYKL